VTFSDGQTCGLETSTALVNETADIAYVSPCVAPSGPPGGTPPPPPPPAASSYEVNLTWNAPASSTDPVVGYYVFRASGSSSTYAQLNATAIPATTATSYAYSDETVANGTTDSYYVTSVDAGGDQSVPSNTITVTVPASAPQQTPAAPVNLNGTVAPVPAASQT
jgi:hypothetical protein